MMSRGILTIALTCLASTSLWCQRTQTQNDLNAQLNGKILVLRNFYSGNNLEYDSDGALLGDAKPGPFTLADIKIESIVLTDSGIEISGKRVGAWFKDAKKDAKPDLLDVGNIRIHVSTPVSDSATPVSLDPILKKIFLADGEDLRPMVPWCWQAYLSGSDFAARSQAYRTMLGQQDDPPVEKQSDTAVTAPRAKSTPDPHYTKEARSRNVEGTSALSVVIETNGTASRIAVMRPLGMGLDEQAVEAISHWTFKPGIKNHQPVRVQILVEITFRCCP